MKLTYTNTARTITIETEVAGSVQAFETLAEFGDVFDEQCCGACASTNIRFDVRRPKGFVYYNLICRDCGSRLDVSQHKKEQGGGLYIDRKDDAGNPKPNAGWYKYQPESDTGEPAPRSTPPKSQSQKTQEPDSYMALIAAAGHRGTLSEVGRQIAADKTITDSRRTVLRAAYESHLATLSKGGKSV